MTASFDSEAPLALTMATLAVLRRKGLLQGEDILEITRLTDQRLEELGLPPEQQPQVTELLTLLRVSVEMMASRRGGGGA